MHHSPAALDERAVARPAADEPPFDPEQWWHETWSAATTPVGGAGTRAAGASRTSRPPLQAWAQRVRAVVWPDACSRAR